MKQNSDFLSLGLIIAVLMSFAVCFASGEISPSTNESAPAVEDAVIDPVCGMTVDPSKAEFNVMLEGKTYYFCSSMCKEAFVADPSKFLSSDENSAIDPVCYMKVSPDTAEANVTFNGTEYYFCTPECKIAFEENPEKYLDASEKNQVIDPVCGMKVDSATAVNSTYNGAEYFFCCPKCQAKFEKSPDKYMSSPDESSVIDPVCGMTVDPKTADTFEYNGKSYFFCSVMCKEEFEKDPKSFLMK